MYRGLRVVALTPVLNEEQKVGEVVRRMPRPLVDEVVVIDDGSSDRSAAVARELGARVLPMGRVLGVGAALRAGPGREAPAGGHPKEAQGALVDANSLHCPWKRRSLLRELRP